MTAAIRVQGLRKRYRGREAVAGIDLVVEPGQVVGLLGPNGAGKTTTVEILEGTGAGMRRRHRARGGSATAGRDWRCGIGIVSQQATDLGLLTVVESVRHFARYYPRPRDPETVLDQVGLTDQATSPVRTLSGGQRRRLDVALGMIGRPDLIFLDEPTTGFDPEARRRFWKLIASVAADGTTVLLTTHYLTRPRYSPTGSP